MTFEELEQHVQSLTETTERMETLLEVIYQQTRYHSYTLEEVAQTFFRRSPKWLRQRPWLLPEPDVPGRPAVWYRTSIEWHLDRPEQELKAAYMLQKGEKHGQRSA